MNEKSKLFFNASAIFDIPMGDSEVTYEIYNYAKEKYKIESGMNLGLGIGYKYNDKYSVELNVHTKEICLSWINKIHLIKTFQLSRIHIILDIIMMKIKKVLRSGSTFLI